MPAMEVIHLRVETLSLRYEIKAKINRIPSIEERLKPRGVGKRRGEAWKDERLTSFTKQFRALSFEAQPAKKNIFSVIFGSGVVSSDDFYGSPRPRWG